MSDTEVKQEESSYEPQQHEPESLQNSQNATPEKPRTVGGFLVDDDEDDSGMPEQAVEADGPNGLLDVEDPSSNAPERSAIPSPPTTQTAQSNGDVPEQANAQDHDPADFVPNGIADDVPLASVPTVDDSKDLGAVESSKDVPAVQVPSAASPKENVKPLPRARLPQDKIGMLEDRIKEDPKGDLDAWMTLINEYKRRNKVDDVRATYNRFLEVFPTSAEQWMAFVNFELETNPPQTLYMAEKVFQASLQTVPNLGLWTTYLNYVRRRNKLTSDVDGSARKIVSQAFDFVIGKIGIDKDAGPLWQEYIQFIRSGPGQAGGSSWQDQQKMDDLRKAFQRAVSVPTQNVQSLWKEYDMFEMGLNKTTARKFLQERSPSYITARTAFTNLQKITQSLNRNTTPVLPPALGFEGEADYMKQVDLWKRWIEWEKEDPLYLKDEELEAYKYRVLYAYKQSVMTMRFWPEFWFEAAEFCFENNMKSEGEDFLEKGAKANPESCLIAFKRADHIECTTSNEGSNEGIRRRGELVRKPYDYLLDALYSLGAKIKAREVSGLEGIEQRFKLQQQQQLEDLEDGDDDAEEAEDRRNREKESRETQKQSQVDAFKKGIAAQTKLVNRTITFAWTALMNAIRRVQGRGSTVSDIPGSRGIFGDARKRGRLTSEIYVASALTEYYSYQDTNISTKIFDRGMRLYLDDETIALEYIKHLIHINDITNARATFESTVQRLSMKPESKEKAKHVYAFFHDFECQFGELMQIKNLEKRMIDLYPNESKSTLFSRRYSNGQFDPTAIRFIVSPATQARTQLPPFAEAASSLLTTPPPSLPSLAPIGNSPKRPYDDSDGEQGPPRKQARAESPLKGAAGRRLDAQKRTNLRNEVQQNGTPSIAPAAPPVTTLPQALWTLLNMLPKAELWGNTVRFDPQKMVDLMRNVDTSRHNIDNQVPNYASSASVSYAGQMPQMPQMQTQYTGYPPPSGNSMYGYQR
ncbi:MAG: mRNA 3'-end-processing protein rna14 [Chrysothrix sp. TS-e1954]|nr:MAG: mRNA 3'-end-processing protein rna14 [Chrysothrix sp. TS-e1954]